MSVRVLAAVLAVVFAAPSAFAQADADVAMTATADVTADVTRTARPIERRALIGDPAKDQYIWVFTGMDFEDTHGVGATARATVRYQPGDTTDASAVLLDGRVWARLFGWQVEGRAALQPVGDLRDPFWRSGRDILQTGLVLTIPPMWGMGWSSRNFWVMSFTVDVGSRHRLDGAWTHAGFDRAVAMVGVRLQGRRAAFDLFAGQFAEYGTHERQVGDTLFGTSVIRLDLDLARARWRPLRGEPLELSARGGLVSLVPLAPYEQTGTSSSSMGPASDTGSYWFEARYGRPVDAAAPGVALSLGGGTWARLDPTGHAVDAGHLATAAASWKRGALDLRGDVSVGRLRRVLLGLMAPQELEIQGTAWWMGRGSLQATYALDDSFDLTASTWVERSDRDDPRWSKTADPGVATGVATHAGVDLLARYRFAR
jgi:hypothetical protein